MSRPKVTWDGPVKHVADRAKLRYFMKRKPILKTETFATLANGKWIFPEKPRKGLRQVSARRKRELKEYSERRISFLLRPENRWCPVMWVLTGKRFPTTDIHHKYSRRGKWLNVDRLWLAVSREGHEWLHQNGAEARRRGWIMDKP